MHLGGVVKIKCNNLNRVLHIIPDIRWCLIGGHLLLLLYCSNLLGFCVFFSLMHPPGRVLTIKDNFSKLAHS